MIKRRRRERREIAGGFPERSPSVFPFLYRATRAKLNRLRATRIPLDLYFSRVDRSRRILILFYLTPCLNSDVIALDGETWRLIEAAYCRSLIGARAISSLSNKCFVIL